MSALNPAGKVILTYGRFDLFDQDHAHFLRRLRGLGQYLIVGCQSDELACRLELPCHLPFEARRAMLDHCRYVDRVIEQHTVEQARTDIVNYDVAILAMGEDNRGTLDHLHNIAEILYLPRREASAMAIGFSPKGPLQRTA